LYASRRIEMSLGRLMEATPEQREQHLERIALELQRSLDNFDRQYGFISIAKLMLPPALAQTGLQEHLAQSLYVPVETFELTQSLDCAAVPELRDEMRQSQCVHVIGAALRDEQAA
jgi:MSHA biogenesis protein MshI